LQTTVCGTHLRYGGFFLAGGGDVIDIDVQWAYICSNGLQIDLEFFYTLPKSKRDKYLEIAKVIEKKKLDELAHLHTLGRVTTINEAFGQ
jgi:hypothetical protein